MFRFIAVISLFMFSHLFSQFPENWKENNVINVYKNQSQNNIEEFNIISKKIRHYTKEDWQKTIDLTWGEGISTDEKLTIFDKAVELIDQKYACFFNLNLNFDSLKTHYRLIVKNGVSRGRFAAIMNKIAFLLMEGHTHIVDTYVSWNTPLNYGTPIFVIGGFVNNSRFGASITPLPDSSLLVYKTVPSNKLGLVPGDIILGYDGVEWKSLYQELLDAELPIRTEWTWGSTNESMTHCLLISAGLNWHLFDTIDVVKYSSGDTVHISTQLLANQSGNIWGNEQLKIDGVPMPDLFNKDYVTWGIVENTNVGYIYVSSWDPNPELNLSNKFYSAIYSLMNNYKTDGLILDFRLNFGGYMPVAHAGYSLLFNAMIREVAYDVRDNPNDHFSMKPHAEFTSQKFTIWGDLNSYYDKPIAVLTGPGAVSNGDWESLRMKFHPMVRTFGRPSSGAFSASSTPYPNLDNSDWFFSLSDGCGYLVDNHKYLSHTGAEVDENVWLTQDDVVKKEDTVVKKAIEWIKSQSTKVNEETIKSEFALFQNYPNPFNPTTEIKYSIPRSTELHSVSHTTLKIYDILGREVVTLVNEKQKAGNYQVTFDASNLSSGAYFFQLKSGNYVQNRKMLIVK